MSTEFKFDSKSLKNPLGLPPDQLKLVIAELGTLGQDLGERAIRYVLDGDGEEVLLSLTGTALAGEGLLLQFSMNTNRYREVNGVRQRRAKILFTSPLPPAEFNMRLGKVYGAICRGRMQRVLPGWPNWLTVLLAEMSLAAEAALSSDATRWTWSYFSEVLQADGGDPELLIRTLLSHEGRLALQALSFSRYGYSPAIKDIEPFLMQRVDMVKAAMTSQSGDELFTTLSLLRDHVTDAKSLIREYVLLAVGSAKTIREPALYMLSKLPHMAVELLKEHLEKGSASERNQAVEGMHRLLGDEISPVLLAHLESETSERVQQTIRKLVTIPTAASPTVETSDAELVIPPALPVPIGEVPLSELAIGELRKAFAKVNQKIEQYNQKQSDQFNSPNRPAWMTQPYRHEPISDRQIADLIGYLTGSTSKGPPPLPMVQQHLDQLGDWFAPPHVELIHVVRLALALGYLHVMTNHGGHRNDIHWYHTRDLDLYHGRCPQKFGLRELEHVLCTLPHVNPGVAGRAWLEGNNSWQSFCDWEPEAIWPYFAEKMEQLDAPLGPSPNKGRNYLTYNYGWGVMKQNAFRALAMFPRLPPKFIPHLWDLALGETKLDRFLAQKALINVPDKASKIIVALGDGRQGVRAAAADWLAELQDPVAIEPLKAAFLKEKQEFVKGKLIHALDCLGANVEEFLDRRKLLKEAEQTLKKKPPKGADWIPLDAMPVLHWADSGEAVDSRIVRAWILQSVARKSPAPDALVQRYLQMCRPLEARNLARFLLSSWISRDTSVMPYDEAVARAKSESQKFWQQYGGKPGYMIYGFYDSEESLYKDLLQRYAAECVATAIGEKGLLSLVAAVGDRDCVRLAEQYIRKWYGQRAAQCKALLEVLAWIEHPSAIQVLLSIGNRFRTKSIQKAASEYVQELADRQGWTIDQLADRTLPDGGFARETNAEGEPVGTVAQLILDYGPRKFVVTLNDELEPVITKEDGKAVKSPPAPAKTDDPELAKAAKKAFSDAKKTVKELVKSQTERLYEAVCTNRRWKFAEWQQYLLQHPIAGRLCTRLVWVAFEPHPQSDQAPFVTAFRPLEDGTFTDHEDNPVELTAEQWIGLAHTCNVPEALETAWTEHLKDYDVEPLFAQFGRKVFALPKDQQDATEISDFQGHMLTTYRLRSKATKLNWIRGSAQDGGGFYWYSKSFPSLQMNAVVEFTGSYLPESDIPCALTVFYFERQKSDQAANDSSSRLPLKKIPPVLLSEIYGDVQSIAAEGSGFDPDWERKGLW